MEITSCSTSNLKREKKDQQSEILRSSSIPVVTQVPVILPRAPRNPTPPPQLLNFFWETIDNVNFPHIALPFIFRDNEKYFSVRMIERAILSEFQNILSEEIKRYGHLASVNLSEAEANTFNEINSEHLQMKYGKERYTVQDSMVKSNTFMEFYDILRRTCRNKHGRFLKQPIVESNQITTSTNITTINKNNNVQAVLNPNLQQRSVPDFVQNNNNTQMPGNYNDQLRRVVLVPSNNNGHPNQIQRPVMMQINNQNSNYSDFQHQQNQNNYIRGDRYHHQMMAQSCPPNDISYNRINNSFVPQNQHNMNAQNTHQQQVAHNQILRNNLSPNLVNQQQVAQNHIIRNNHSPNLVNQQQVAQNQIIRNNHSPNLVNQQQLAPNQILRNNHTLVNLQQNSIAPTQPVLNTQSNLQNQSIYAPRVPSPNYVRSGNSPGFQNAQINGLQQSNYRPITPPLNQIPPHMQNYQLNNQVKPVNQTYCQIRPAASVAVRKNNPVIVACLNSPHAVTNILSSNNSSSNSVTMPSATTLGVSENSQDFLQQLKSKIQDPTSPINDTRPNNTVTTEAQQNQVENKEIHTENNLLSNAAAQIVRQISNKDLNTQLGSAQTVQNKTEANTTTEAQVPTNKNDLPAAVVQNKAQTSVSSNGDDDIIILDSEPCEKTTDAPCRILTNIKAETQNYDQNTNPITSKKSFSPITLNTEIISGATRTIQSKQPKKKSESQMSLSSTEPSSTSEINEEKTFLQINQYKIPYVIGIGDYRISLRSRICDKYLSCATLAKIGLLPTDMNENQLKRTFKSYRLASESQLNGLKSNESGYTRSTIFENGNKGIICFSELFLNYLTKPFYVKCIPQNKEIVYNININEALFKMTGGIILINSPNHKIMSPFREFEAKILVPESVVKKALQDIEPSRIFEPEPRLAKKEEVLLKNFFQILMFYFLYTNEKINDVHLIDIKKWIENYPKNFVITNRFTENFPSDWIQLENIQETEILIPSSIKSSPKVIENNRSTEIGSLSPNSLCSESSVGSFKMTRKLCTIQSVCSLQSIGSRSNSIRGSVSSDEGLTSIKALTSIKTEAKDPIVNKKEILSSIEKFDKIVKSRSNNDDSYTEATQSSTQFFGSLRRVYSSSNFFTQEEYALCYSRFNKVKRSESTYQINARDTLTKKLINDNSRIMDNIKTLLLNNVQKVSRIFREYLFNNSYHVRLLISIDRRQLNKNLKKFNINQKLKALKKKEKKINEKLVDIKPTIAELAIAKNQAEKTSNESQQTSKAHSKNRALSNNRKRRRKRISSSSSSTYSLRSTETDQKSIKQESTIKPNTMFDNLKEKHDLFTTDLFDEELFLRKYNIKPCKVRLVTLGPQHLSAQKKSMRKPKRKKSTKPLLKQVLTKRSQINKTHQNDASTTITVKKSPSSKPGAISSEVEACSSENITKSITNNKHQLLGNLDNITNLPEPKKKLESESDDDDLPDLDI